MRQELTHGSGAKTLINGHGQLIHITLDGQYHLMAEGMDLSLKQLEELVSVINRQEGQWNHPTVSAKIQELQVPDDSPPFPPPAPAADPSVETQAPTEETDSLKQQLA